MKDKTVIPFLKYIKAGNTRSGCCQLFSDKKPIKDGNGVSAIFLGTVAVKVLVFCCFLNVFIESLHFWCIKNVNNS